MDRVIQVYEKEVRARCGDGGLHRDLSALFSTLHDGGVTDDVGRTSPKSVPKPASTKVAVKKRSVIKPVLKTKMKRSVKVYK